MLSEVTLHFTQRSGVLGFFSPGNTITVFVTAEALICEWVNQLKTQQDSCPCKNWCYGLHENCENQDTSWWFHFVRTKMIQLTGKVHHIGQRTTSVQKETRWWTLSYCPSSTPPLFVYVTAGWIKILDAITTSKLKGRCTHQYIVLESHHQSPYLLLHHSVAHLSQHMTQTGAFHEKVRKSYWHQWVFLMIPARTRKKASRIVVDPLCRVSPPPMARGSLPPTPATHSITYTQTYAKLHFTLSLSNSCQCTQSIYDLLILYNCCIWKYIFILSLLTCTDIV